MLYAIPQWVLLWRGIVRGLGVPQSLCRCSKYSVHWGDAWICKTRWYQDCDIWQLEWFAYLNCQGLNSHNYIEITTENSIVWQSWIKVPYCACGLYCCNLGDMGDNCNVCKIYNVRKAPVNQTQSKSATTTSNVLLTASSSHLQAMEGVRAIHEPP